MSASVLLAFLNYNTSEELRGALSTLPEAAGDVPYDLVIIDNASTAPGEREKLEDLKGEGELLCLPENLGFAGAFNRILARRDHDYFLLLNSDLLLPPGLLGDLLGEAAKIPDLGLANVSFVREDGSPQFSYGPTPDLWSELTNRSLSQKRYRKAHPAKDEPMEVESLLGAMMLVTKKALEKAGPLDERFFFFFEETEWCCRMRDQGFKVCHLPMIKVCHLQGRSANKVPLRARVEFHRSRALFFKLRYGSLAKFILNAGVFTRTAVNLVFYCLFTLLTLFINEKIRNKTRLYAGIVGWYLRGCPASAGLDGRLWRK